MVGFEVGPRCLLAAAERGDGFSIAVGIEQVHGVFGEVAAVAGLPFVVYVGEDGADEADDGGVVGENADDAGAAFDFFVDPLQRIRGPDLLPVRLGERGEREDFGLGVVHERADLRERGSEPVTDLLPSRDGGSLVWLGEDGAEHRGDHVGLVFGHMGEQVAGEVDSAALVPGALETTSQRLDQA